MVRALAGDSTMTRDLVLTEIEFLTETIGPQGRRR
jgi:hypothetical protein